MRGIAVTRTSGVVAGAGLLLGVAVALARVAWSSRTGMTAGAPGAVRVDEVVVLAAAVGGALVATWLAVGALVALSAALGGGPRSRLVPGAVYLLVAAVLGVGALPAAADATPHVTGGTTPVAVAAAPTPAASMVDPGWGAPAVPAATTVDPGWRPAAPASPPRTAPGAETAVLGSLRADLAADDEVVVRRGDTLWDLAARHLGPDAGDAEIAAEWPRWHGANREVIGADPDLLLPGQRLHPPP